MVVLPTRRHVSRRPLNSGHETRTCRSLNECGSEGTVPRPIRALGNSVGHPQPDRQGPSTVLLGFSSCLPAPSGAASGWDIKDDGFGVVLSPELPSLMRKALAPAVQDFLDRNGLRLDEFNGLLFHPGGRKLLETMEQVLKVERRMLDHSWEVLRRYGNMSSATALFVLQRALQAGASGPHLLAAFGPGFSAYFVAADL